MKKLRFLIFSLVLVFMLSFTLTACGKKDGGDKGKYNETKVVQTSDDVLLHNDEFVAFILEEGNASAITNKADYELLKTTLTEAIEPTLFEQITKTNLDAFVLQVLAEAGINHGFIKDILSLATKLAKATNDLGKEYERLATAYPFNYNIETLADYYSDYYGEYNDFANFDVQNLSQLQAKKYISNALEALANMASNSIGIGASAITDIQMIMEDNISSQPFVVGSADYHSLTAKIKEYYNANLALAQKVYNVELFAKILVNIASSDAFVAISQTLFPTDGNFISAAVETLRNEIGIANPAIKEAYVKAMSILGDNLLSQTLLIYNGLSFDDLLAIYEPTFTDDGMESVMGDDYITKSLAMVNLIGSKIKNGFMTDAERTELVNACKVLNNDGLGYYVDRYVDLYRYGLDFVGEALASLNVTDVMDGVSVGLALAMAESEAEANSANVLISKVSADKFLAVYNGYQYKAQLRASFKDNVSFDSLIEQIGVLANNVNKAEVYIQGNWDFEAITEEDFTTMESAIRGIDNVQEVWLASNYEYLQGGLEALNTYLKPLLQLVGFESLNDFMAAIK